MLACAVEHNLCGLSGAATACSFSIVATWIVSCQKTKTNIGGQRVRLRAK